MSSMNDARHRDLTNIIDRARDLESLALFERVAGHELTPDLRALLARKVQQIKTQSNQDK